MIVARYTAAFMTGHSVPGCTGLSREQRAFQHRSIIADHHWQSYNFPFDKTIPFPEGTGLVRSSFNNVRHFFYSQRPAFRQQYRDAVTARFSQYNTVILLTGSCGLEILNNLNLPEFILHRIHVFAFGPVSRRRPDTASCFVVQGKYDFISRCFHRKADCRLLSSHMGYLLHPETLRWFNEFCEQVLHHSTETP